MDCSLPLLFMSRIYTMGQLSQQMQSTVWFLSDCSPLGPHVWLWSARGKFSPSVTASPPNSYVPGVECEIGRFHLPTTPNEPKSINPMIWLLLNFHPSHTIMHSTVREGVSPYTRLSKSNSNVRPTRTRTDTVHSMSSSQLSMMAKWERWRTIGIDASANGEVASRKDMEDHQHQRVGPRRDDTDPITITGRSW